MNDSGPTRLALLRFLERVQLRDLERTHGWITEGARPSSSGAQRRGRPRPTGSWSAA
ncbi:hypothetical protein ACFUV1_08550 [Streptomyces griseoincarnatus]|uniref:hypothetical protein n=1 Tax=Streptomyces sp. I4(2020) TaxID=2760981 RepID=UPI0018EEA32F|nr:hypothetical protein [Streptomyces sp. I4(2020)]MBJ6630232.1 hypothetical protein [Streptomyces sp. I4(2020)]